MVVPMPIRHRMRQSSPSDFPRIERGRQTRRHGDRQEHQRIAAGMRDIAQIEAGAENDDAGFQAKLADVADFQRAEADRVAQRIGDHHADRDREQGRADQRDCFAREQRDRGDEDAEPKSGGEFRPSGGVRPDRVATAAVGGRVIRVLPRARGPVFGSILAPLVSRHKTKTIRRRRFSMRDARLARSTGRRRAVAHRDIAPRSRGSPRGGRDQFARAN